MMQERDERYRLFFYQAISRALHANKHEITIWDSTIKNIYDIYDEIKPTKVIYSTKTLEGKIKKLGLDSWTINSIEKLPLLYDPILFRKIDRIEAVAHKNICISIFDEVEKLDSPELLSLIDKKTRDFVYFGNRRIGGHKDCGLIQENAYSMFLSSAENVLALSDEFAVNALSCNDNVSGTNLTKNDIDKYSSFEFIKGII